MCFKLISPATRVQHFPINGSMRPTNGASRHAGAAQARMRTPVAQVEAIEQPVQLLATQDDRRSVAAWPVKAVTLEPLLLQHEAVRLPVQELHLRASPVGEDEQLLR